MVALVAENVVDGEYIDEFDVQYQRITAEINELKKQQIEARQKQYLAENYNQRVKDMGKVLTNGIQQLPVFNDDLVRRLISSIKILLAKTVMIQFKSGVVMEKELG